MRVGRTISVSRRDAWIFGVSIAVHVILLVWGALTFATRLPATDSAPMPIDIISVSEFTQLTAGSRNAPKQEPAKPVADTLGERKPADDPAAKIAKTEVHAATDAAAPLPEPKPPTPEKKQSEPQRDLIAEAIKKDLEKDEPKKAEQKKADPKPEKKAEAKAEQKAAPKKEQPKFDPRNVAALLDKRTPQRVAATGDVVNSNVGIGVPNANSNQPSLSELDAFRRHLGNCWTAPPGRSDGLKITVPVPIRLKTDRTLA